jgi:molecular chaperone HtpG
MEDLSLDEREIASELVACAEATLRPFSIEASVKKFHPTDVPALYALSQAQLFDRDAARVQDESDQLFSGIVSDLRKAMKTEAPQLVLNLDNPVVRRLASLHDPDRLRVFVELLYVQALLLGQHPLQARELAILNKGLVSLMAAQLEAPATRGGGGGLH